MNRESAYSSAYFKEFSNMTWTESWNTVELGEISTGIKTWEIFVFSRCLIYSPFSGFGSWPVSVQRLMTIFLFLFLQWPRCNIRADRISRITPTLELVKFYEKKILLDWLAHDEHNIQYVFIYKRLNLT